MKKYLYLIKKAKIKSWLKFWLLTKDQVKYILSEILEGFSFDLQNTVKRYFKIFNIFGNSVQDGTPTPTNPVPIESVADDVNLFDLKNFLSDRNVSYTENEDGSLTFITSSALYLSPLQFSNEDIIVSMSGILTTLETMSNSAIQVLNSNNTVVGQINLSNSKIENITGSKLRFNMTSNKTITLKNIKLQKGTVTTPYSPYNYGTFTIDFEGQTENYNYTFITKPLRSLPNGVRDSLEADGIHRRVGRIVLDGSEIWYYYTDTGKPVFYLMTEEYIFYKQQSGLLCLSNYYQGKGQKASFDDIYNLGNNTITFRSTLTRLVIRNDNITNVQDFKNWLSTHNTEVLYELAEETIEPYTEEQQEQYNKIKDLYTFDGTTNISSTDVVPPYLQIQYYMKGE